MCSSDSPHLLFYLYIGLVAKVSRSSKMSHKGSGVFCKHISTFRFDQTCYETLTLTVLRVLHVLDINKLKVLMGAKLWFALYSNHGLIGLEGMICSQKAPLVQSFMCLCVMAKIKWLRIRQFLFQLVKKHQVLKLEPARWSSINVFSMVVVMNPWNGQLAALLVTAKCTGI